MSRSVLTNLDLNKNEIQNAVLQPLAAAPANPKQFQVYTNSQDKVIYQYDGEKWKPVGVVYNQAGGTGAVIVGLDASGNVSTQKHTSHTDAQTLRLGLRNTASAGLYIAMGCS